MMAKTLRSWFTNGMDNEPIKRKKYISHKKEVPQCGTSFFCIYIVKMPCLRITANNLNFDTVTFTNARSSFQFPQFLIVKKNKYICNKIKQISVFTICTDTCYIIN